MCMSRTVVGHRARYVLFMKILTFKRLIYVLRYFIIYYDVYTCNVVEYAWSWFFFNETRIKLVFFKILLSQITFSEIGLLIYLLHFIYYIHIYRFIRA